MTYLDEGICLLQQLRKTRNDRIKNGPIEGLHGKDNHLPTKKTNTKGSRNYTGPSTSNTTPKESTPSKNQIESRGN